MSPYCDGCNTHWTDTGCGQLEEHARCPIPCGMCGQPITGRDRDGCHGHTMDEVRAMLAEIRSRQ